MSAKALYCDESGDIAITNHRLRLTENNLEYSKQRHRQRLKFFLGDWFLDLNLGIPYFRYILVKNPDLNLISALYAQTILGTGGTKAIMSLDLELRRAERELLVHYTALLESGEILANQSVNIPFSG